MVEGASGDGKEVLSVWVSPLGTWGPSHSSKTGSASLGACILALGRHWAWVVGGGGTSMAALLGACLDSS